MFREFARRAVLCWILVTAPFAVFAQDGEAVARKIEWRQVDGARAYELEVQDSSGNTIVKTRIEEPEAEVSLLPGSYRLRVSVLNRFLKVSASSDWIELEVLKAVQPVAERISPRQLPAGADEAAITVEGRGIGPDTRAVLVRGNERYEGRLLEAADGRALWAFSFGSPQPGDFDLILENPANKASRVVAALSLPPPDTLLAVAAPKEAPLVAEADGLLAEPVLPPAEPIPVEVVPVEVASEPPPPETPVETTFVPLAPADSISAREDAPDLRGRRVWLESGWSGGLFLGGALGESYPFGYAGGSLRLLAAFGELFNGSPILRCFGFEFRTDLLRYAREDGGESASFLNGSVGSGLYIKTAFNFPVNALLRGGLGIAFTSIDAESQLGSASLVSQDSMLYGGGGFKINLGNHFFDVGVDWVGGFYVGGLVQQLRFNTLFALALF